MSPIRLHNITPTTILTYIFAGLAVLLLLAYIIFQARLLIAGPQVVLETELPGVQTERQITLAGSAENITGITLNGRPILTDIEGHFSENVILENGYTIVSIKAQDRYGRETKIEREFVYVPRSVLLN